MSGSTSPVRCAPQSPLMSFVEALANVCVGYAAAVLTQLIVFPWFGLPARLDDALAIGLIFTLVSIVRSFALRRAFEAIGRSTHQRTVIWRHCAGDDAQALVSRKDARLGRCARRQSMQPVG